LIVSAVTSSMNDCSML